jgi:hypothetical protein
MGDKPGRFQDFPGALKERFSMALLARDLAFR